MYIKDKGTADFFGVPDIEPSSWIQAFGQEMHYQAWQLYPNTILLGKERTLYDYKITDIYEVYKRIGEQVLIVLSQWLSAARWNGERSWINTQHNTSNFNMNMFLTIPRAQADNIWGLQEIISVAIAKALSGILPKWEIEIAYPFHYLKAWGKVAGHLAQKVGIDDGNSFVRIGIGINSAMMPPKLPENDELAKRLFTAPTSINITPRIWPALAEILGKNIQQALAAWQSHDEYLKFLNLKKWDQVTVYSDTGGIEFWKKLADWIYDRVSNRGDIELLGEIIPGGKSYHIVKG